MPNILLLQVRLEISVAVLYSICSVVGMLMVGYWAQPLTTWFFTDQEYVKIIWYRLSVIGEQIWSNTNCTSLTKSMQIVRYENVTIDTTLPMIFNYRYSDKTTHKNGIYNSPTPTNTHCHIATATALYRHTCSLFIGIHLSPFFPSPRKLWPPKPRHRDCGGVLHHPGATKVSRFGSLRYVSSLFSNTKSIVLFPCSLDVFSGNSLTHWLLQSMCSPYTNPMETQLLTVASPKQVYGCGGFNPLKE